MKATSPPQGNSFEKRKLIKLFVWSRKIYETWNEEQGIFISQERTMGNIFNIDIIKKMVS